MPSRLLDTKGAITVVADDHFTAAIELLGDTDTSDLDASVYDAPELIVSFPTSADGRGFSLAAELREGNAFTGNLYATGELNPDQLSLSFQCGFDGVIVSESQWDRYGESSWVQAMDPLVNKTYLRTHWQQLDPIWERRTTSPGS